MVIMLPTQVSLLLRVLLFIHDAQIVQRALFSATISPLVRELADGFFLRNPVCVSVGAENAGANCMLYMFYYSNHFLNLSASVSSFSSTQEPVRSTNA